MGVAIAYELGGSLSQINRTMDEIEDGQAPAQEQTTTKPNPFKGTQGPSTSISRRSKPEPMCLFKEKCFSCNHGAGLEFEQLQAKYEAERRRKIVLVTDATTRASILKFCEARRDYEGDLILARIQNVPEVGAKYHYDCYLRFAKFKFVDEDNVPVDSSLDKCTKFAIGYILENNDDCQFSLREIIEKSGEDVTDLRTIKTKLNDYFFGKITFSTTRNDCIITYLGGSEDFFADFLVEKRSHDENVERQKIVFYGSENHIE
ncbi:hypothetical protein QAD02_020538 [Eretmocerus hayati]|uniref:Uncharacterized protein n=1 Tax=Eretmocerus hayati TaxID=131215 RepID=A0ACC2PMB4_9HYME|nr:hypothetical protein QAD02_020538 [Eretmocerus hayati]